MGRYVPLVVLIVLNSNSARTLAQVDAHEQRAVEPVPEHADASAQSQWPAAWDSDSKKDVLQGSKSRLSSRGNTRRIMSRTLMISTGLATACFLIFVWSRKGAGGASGKANVDMQLRGTLTLAPRCYLQLVTVNRQNFLVARDGNVVRCMTRVDRFADTFDALDASDPGEVGGRNELPEAEMERRDSVSSISDRYSTETHNPSFCSRPGRSEHAGAHHLSDASAAGLSLETGGRLKRSISDLDSTIKRSDPWPGSLMDRT